MAGKWLKRLALFVIAAAIIYPTLPFKPWPRHTVAVILPAAAGCTGSYPIHLRMTGALAKYIAACTDVSGRAELFISRSRLPIGIVVTRGRVVYWDPTEVPNTDLVEYQSVLDSAGQTGSAAVPAISHVLLPGRSVAIVQVGNRTIHVAFYTRESWVVASYYALNFESYVLERVNPAQAIQTSVEGCASRLGTVVGADVAEQPSTISSAIKNTFESTASCQSIARMTFDPLSSPVDIASRARARLRLPGDTPSNLRAFDAADVASQAVDARDIVTLESGTGDVSAEMVVAEDSVDVAGNLLFEK